MVGVATPAQMITLEQGITPSLSRQKLSPTGAKIRSVVRVRLQGFKVPWRASGGLLGGPTFAAALPVSVSLREKRSEANRFRAAISATSTSWRTHSGSEESWFEPRRGNFLVFNVAMGLVSGPVPTRVH